MASPIDFRHTSQTDAAEGRFPAEVETEYRVHLTEAAHRSMSAHAGTTSEVEVCGVLVGEVKRDAAGAFLLIQATIEGRHANNYGAQVTFTHQTWEYINSVKDSQHPSQRIVGWYHTHPGFGVFLSKMDMFIQENFFNLPFQVAIVLETKKKEEGCFAWHGGVCVPLRRYWVGQAEVKLATGAVENAGSPAEAVAADPVAPARRAPEPVDPAAPLSPYTIALLVLLLVCGFLLGRTLMMHDLRRTVLDSLESEIYSVLEFAGINELAARDFAEAEEKVKAARARLSPTGAAEAAGALDEVEAQLARLAATYDKRRGQLRADLGRMMTQRQLVSDRIAAVGQRQAQLEAYVGHLYLLRLQQLLYRDGRPIDLRALDAAEREGLKQMVGAVVRMLPDAKGALERMHPGLMELLYPAGTGSDSLGVDVK